MRISRGVLERAAKEAAEEVKDNIPGHLRDVVSDVLPVVQGDSITLRIVRQEGDIDSGASIVARDENGRAKFLTSGVPVNLSTRDETGAMISPRDSDYMLNSVISDAINNAVSQISEDIDSVDDLSLAVDDDGAREFLRKLGA